MIFLPVLLSGGKASGRDGRPADQRLKINRRRPRASHRQTTLFYKKGNLFGFLEKAMKTIFFRDREF